MISCFHPCESWINTIVFIIKPLRVKRETRTEARLPVKIIYPSFWDNRCKVQLSSGLLSDVGLQLFETLKYKKKDFLAGQSRRSFLRLKWGWTSFGFLINPVEITSCSLLLLYFNICKTLLFDPLTTAHKGTWVTCVFYGSPFSQCSHLTYSTSPWSLKWTLKRH